MTSPSDPTPQEPGSDQPGSFNHGGFSAAPPPADASGRPRRPSTLTTSFWLGIASVVVGFVLVGFAAGTVSDSGMRQLQQTLAAQGQHYSLADVRSMYQGMIAVGLVVLVIVAALWVLFLFYMRNGRNWARVVITVVGVLWILFFLPSASVGTAAQAVSFALAIVQVLMLIATLVLAYLRPSQEFFTAFRKR